MRFLAAVEGTPIFNELVAEWEKRQQADPEPEQEAESRSSIWQKVYRGLTSRLPGAWSGDSVAYRPTHRRLAYV